MQEFSEAGNEQAEAEVIEEVTAEEDRDSSKPKNSLAETMVEIMRKNIQEQENSPRFEAMQFVEQYASAKVVETDAEALAFWEAKASSNRPIDIVASKVAELYLSPPATSVDVERLFSTAGDIRTQERNSLLPENAAKLLFLKENLPRIGFNY